jgi:hypothetical protein
VSRRQRSPRWFVSCKALPYARTVMYVMGIGAARHCSRGEGIGPAASRPPLSARQST